MLCDHLQLPNAEKLEFHRWRSTLADCWDNLASEVVCSFLPQCQRVTNQHACCATTCSCPTKTNWTSIAGTIWPLR